MKYHFEHRAKANGEGAVRLVYHTQGQRLTLGLGIVVPVTEWDKGRAFVRPSSPHYIRMTAIRAELDQLVVRCLREGRAITAADVRLAVLGEEVPAAVAAKEEPKPVDVWAWLFDAANGRADCYRAALVCYQRHDGSTPTQSTLTAWNRWLVSNSGKSPGTGHTYLGAVSALLHEAKRAGVIEWTAEVKRPSVPGKRGKIALTDAQVRALEGLKLRGELEVVRDLFLLGVYTSLRRSDWNIRTTDIGTTINTRKTKGTALIVDTPKLRRLLDKYGGHLHLELFHPDGLETTTQVLRFDRLLGQVMEQLAAKCPELRETVQHRGTVVPRWQAIGSHSGRKSFISKHATRLPLPVVMRATGHRSLAQLHAYVQHIVPDADTAKLFG